MKTSMEWTNDMVLEFLHNYEQEPVLWDPKNKHRKNRRYVNEAWARIQRNITWSCSVEDLRRKKESLMAYYRSHLNRIKKMKTEPGADHVYETSWFAFESMHSFLGKLYDMDADKSYVEDVYQDAPSRQEYSDSENSEPERKVRIVASKRKLLQVVKKYPEESMISQENTEEDSKNYCDMYGALLAHKLICLPEEDRLILMNQIDNLVFETTLQARKKKHGEFD